MLKQQIQNDLKQAMLAKDEVQLSIIRMLKSAIQYYEINKGAEIAKRLSSPANEVDRRGGAGYEATDEDVIDVVGKEIKKRREAIELYEKGGRQELADKEKHEIEILQSYMPEQISEDEIKRLVEEAITTTGASSIQEMGKVMGNLIPKIRGKADPSMVSSLVKEKLS